jgi:hypothetical protein
VFFAPPLLCAISWRDFTASYKKDSAGKFPSASLIKRQKIRQWKYFLIFWFLLTYVAKILLNLLEIFRQGFVTSRLPAKKSYSTKSFRRKLLGRYKYLKGFYVLHFFRVIRRIYATLILMGEKLCTAVRRTVTYPTNDATLHVY